MREHTRRLRGSEPNGWIYLYSPLADHYARFGDLRGRNSYQRRHRRFGTEANHRSRHLERPDGPAPSFFPNEHGEAMRKIQIAVPTSLKPCRDVRHAKRGFSLTELMIAMLVFTIVAGAAFSLFGQQAGVATQQQTLSAVNIGLRNAISQMEMDMAGGGGNMLAGITQGSGVTPFNLSVIINNNMPGVAATCAPNTTTWAYPTASACYDSLTILSPNTSLVKQCGTGQTPPLNLTSPSIVNLASASTVTADDAN